MNCKLITEHDCAIKVVLSCTPVEFLIINKTISLCSANEDFAESDRKTMALMGKAMMNFEQVEVADTPQTDYPCNTCANKSDHYGECQNCVADSEPIRWKTPSHYKPKQTDCPKSCPT